jgi:hypothetical protein
MALGLANQMHERTCSPTSVHISSGRAGENAGGLPLGSSTALWGDILLFGPVQNMKVAWLDVLAVKFSRFCQFPACPK